jgi:hypothetical protein
MTVVIASAIYPYLGIKIILSTILTTADSIVPIGINTVFSMHIQHSLRMHT